MQYFITLVALLGLSFTLAGAGLFSVGPLFMLLGLMVAPAVVAIHFVSIGAVAAIGLVIGVSVGAFLGAGSLLVAGYHALAAAGGCLLGLGLKRHWTFGRCVAVMTAASYLPLAGVVLLTWDESRAFACAMLDAQLAEMRHAAGITADPDAAPEVRNPEIPVVETVEDQAPAAAAGADAAPQGAEAAAPANEEADVPVLAETAVVIRWMKENWDAINLGLTFWPMLVFSLIIVGFTARWVRLRLGRAGVLGGFRDMRPPDWLVWVAILVAVALIGNRWADSPWIRNVCWNTAIGLTAVYFLNGLAVLMFALGVMQLHPFVGAAATLALLLSQAGQFALCGVGFFDTWAEFRPRLVRAMAARRLRRDKPPEDDEL